MAFKIGDAVKTVYGVGKVTEVTKQTETRKEGYVVLLDNWALAQGQSPTCYLNEEALEIYKSPVGSVVSTFIGPCKVIEVRGGRTYVCEPTVWKLADYSSTQVKAYFNAEAVNFMDAVTTTDACC